MEQGELQVKSETGQELETKFEISNPAVNPEEP